MVTLIVFSNSLFDSFVVTTKIKVQPSKPSSKSVFFKKHIFHKEEGESFGFNFKEPEPDGVENISERMNTVNIDNLESKTDFTFQPSDNSFRFNFNAI